ncbi:MAG TPA: hypothetical protein PKD54_02370 [Pirellulaceae bacterium]|nr:hypothetical protein [Pirellulaceae bacterium]
MAKLDPESEYGWSIVQGRNPGTEVHIRLSARGNTILSLGSADARGGDQPRLMTVEGQALKPPRGGADFDFFSQISEDGQHCVFPLRSEELPPAGANQLKMAGKVKLTTGMDLQTKRVKMDVVKDAKVEVGEIRLTLSEVEDDMFGENAWLLTFQSSQSLATIKEIKFFSDGGAEIESSSAGSHSFGFGNQMTYGRSFRVMGKPASLQVEVRYYASTKEVEVPLEMTFELNLNR